MPHFALEQCYTVRAPVAALSAIRPVHKVHCLSPRRLAVCLLSVWLAQGTHIAAFCAVHVTIQGRINQLAINLSLMHPKALG